MTNLRLGSGRVVAAGVGSKAANLDRAAVAGLAVPAGLVMLHADVRTVDSLPVDALHLDRNELAELASVSSMVVVRSAFSVEDGSGSAMAGHFHTELGVEPTVAAVLDAARRVRLSGDCAGSCSPGARLDVLVMAQVDAVHSGVVFTQGQYEDDLVNVTDGLADRLLGGTEPGERFSLAKVRRFERADCRLAPWQQRLSTLMRSVRGEFGEADWDVEWADDGTRCWLIQVRPITAPPRRNEAFTIANHKEILPELPSVLMTSVIESSAYDLMDHYRRADPTLPVARPFIESFAGRPYINLSQLTDLLRRLGLPTRLLSESLGGDPEIIVGLRPQRIVLRAPAFVRLGVAQLTAVGHARSTERRLDALAARPSPEFASTLDALRATYIALVTEMSALATAMAGPVSLLRSFDVLDTHIARHRTAATQMLDDLDPLIERAAADPAIRTALDAGRVPDDADFVPEWQHWLERHGHRGVFESDVARPRFTERPEPILRAILHGVGGTGVRGRQVPPRTARSVVTLPLWFAARRPMAARERIRWQAMTAFAEYRHRLLQLGSEAHRDGLLPDAEAVFDLSIEELHAVDRGEAFTAGRWKQRRSDIDELAAMRLPELVHRFDDLDAAVTESPGSQRSDVHRGLALTRGTVEGRALRCSEPPTRLPDGFDGSDTVLIARSVDAGWVPIFGQVAAVAVEIGGDLSHGSIILRELGIPAVTNVGAMTGIETGDPVRLDADRATLTLIPTNPPPPK